MLTCASRVMAAMANTNSESMARSVTTVPNALAKSILSYRLSTAQRANSPIRGITKLTAYETKMACMAVDALGFSPIGSSVCRHLHPLNTWAMMPKGKESSIQVQFISWSITRSTCLKSKPRYIQYNIAPPRKSDRATLNVSFIIRLTFNFSRINTLQK